MNDNTGNEMLGAFDEVAGINERNAAAAVGNITRMAARSTQSNYSARARLIDKMVKENAVTLTDVAKVGELSRALDNTLITAFDTAEARRLACLVLSERSNFLLVQDGLPSSDMTTTDILLPELQRATITPDLVKRLVDALESPNGSAAIANVLRESSGLQEMLRKYTGVVDETGPFVVRDTLTIRQSQIEPDMDITKILKPTLAGLNFTVNATRVFKIKCDFYDSLLKGTVIVPGVRGPNADGSISYSADNARDLTNMFWSTLDTPGLNQLRDIVHDFNTNGGDASQLLTVAQQNATQYSDIPSYAQVWSTLASCGLLSGKRARGPLDEFRLIISASEQGHALRELQHAVSMPGHPIRRLLSNRNITSKDPMKAIVLLLYSDKKQAGMTENNLKIHIGLALYYQQLVEKSLGFAVLVPKGSHDRIHTINSYLIEAALELFIKSAEPFMDHVNTIGETVVYQMLNITTSERAALRLRVAKIDSGKKPGALDHHTIEDVAQHVAFAYGPHRGNMSEAITETDNENDDIDMAGMSVVDQVDAEEFVVNDGEDMDNVADRVAQ